MKNVRMADAASLFGDVSSKQHDPEIDKGGGRL